MADSRRLRVDLPSGGYLFIERTEAMHVVDVNSGRSGRGLSQEEIDLEELPATRTKVMLNLGNPSAAFRWWSRAGARISGTASSSWKPTRTVTKGLLQRGSVCRSMAPMDCYP